MRVLGIIPARGGSKGVPLKNIMPLCGRPLLLYTIETAGKVAALDRLVVSTDSLDIAAIAESAGCEVIMRPADISGDEAPTEKALLHCVDQLELESKWEADAVLTLEPTSPFRRAETISRCIEMLSRKEVNSVIGVVETRSCYGRIKDDRYEFLFPGQPRRRQDRAPLYRESSTIYGTMVSTLRRKSSVLGDDLFALIVDETEAVDINTMDDFRMAEAIMSLLQSSNGKMSSNSRYKGQADDQ